MNKIFTDFYICALPLISRLFSQGEVKVSKYGMWDRVSLKYVQVIMFLIKNAVDKYFRRFPIHGLYMISVMSALPTLAT